MSQVDYDRQFEAQDGLCYLCQKPCKQHDILSVDRCKIIGIRKLLCMCCLSFIERFKHDPIRIRRAIEYLGEDHRLPHVRIAHNENWQESEIKTKTYVDRGGILCKWCNRCQTYKPVESCFYPRKTHNGRPAYRNWCIECEEGARWAQRYGINAATREHWQLIQAHACWICEQQLPLCTDHEHGEGRRNRALLCNPCNEGLGFFKEDTELMLTAADYLEQHALPYLAAFLPITEALIEEVTVV